MGKSREDKLRILGQLNRSDMISDQDLFTQLNKLATNIDTYDKNFIKIKEERLKEKVELVDKFISFLEFEITNSYVVD